MIQEFLTCTEKLTDSQLNLPHGTKNRKIRKRTKKKNDLLRDIVGVTATEAVRNIP